MVYANVYHTDKGVTACPDQGHYGKFTTVSDIFRGKGVTFAEKLYELYTTSALSNYSCARAEIRVPLAHAIEPMIILSTSVLQSCLVSFSREEWWSLRAYRVLALKYIMEWQLAGPPPFRLQESALLLTAAVPWLLNGIHLTPDTMPASRELMKAVLPHAPRRGVTSDHFAYRMSLRANEDEEDGQDGEDREESEPQNTGNDRVDDRADEDNRDYGGDTIPHNPFGLVFLRPMRVGAEYPVPRLDDEGRFRLSDASFKVHFSEERKDIEVQIYRSRISAPRHPARIPNRIRQRVITPPPPSSTSRNPFDLPANQHTIHPPPRDCGSDLELDSDDSDKFSGNVNEDLWLLWNQFCVDITAVSPNRKGVRNPPYCKLDAEERKGVNTATYQNRKLSDYFDDVQWKSAPTADWRKNFDRLFPEKGAPPKSDNVQHYGTTVFYPMWLELMDRVTDETFKAIRKEIWKSFKSLFWMPASSSERIWETRPTKSFSKSSSYAVSIAAPKILLNGRHAKPEWDVSDD